MTLETEALRREIHELRERLALVAEMSMDLRAHLTSQGDAIAELTRRQLAPGHVDIAGLRAELAETARTRDELVESYQVLRRDRDEWKRRYDNAPAQEAYDALRAECERLQSDDNTAADVLRVAVEDNLPQYTLGDTDDEANHVERIEYAGDELRELRRDARNADEVERRTVTAIANWLERRAADILAPNRHCIESQHRAAGLTDAVDALRAGTWREL